MKISPFEVPSLDDPAQAKLGVQYWAHGELGQGGPTLGHLRIGLREVQYQGQQATFGLPLRPDGKWIYAPLLQAQRFRLAKISVETAEVVATGPETHGLILIYWNDRGLVKYFTDLDNSNESSFEFSDR